MQNIEIANSKEKELQNDRPLDIADWSRASTPLSIRPSTCPSIRPDSTRLVSGLSVAESRSLLPDVLLSA